MRRRLGVGAASYAALAESLEVPLVTRDPDLLDAAAHLLLRAAGISGYPMAGVIDVAR
jgi:predicted nucleic acid-binding protein